MMNSQSAMASQDHVRKVVARSGTSFIWAMRVLHRRKRDAMYALYAFCREVDDIVDEPGEVVQKKLRLDAWRIEINNIYSGQPNTPTGWALRESIARFQLNQEDFQIIIDGMQSDAPSEVRVKSLEDLELYMDQVACSVGRLSNQIFGIERSLALDIAKALGQALQLTNILRDVEEDAGLNRLYLPEQMLREHGFDGSSTYDLSGITQNPAVEKTCLELHQMAEGQFARARSLLSQTTRVQSRAANMMLEVYQRLLHKLNHRGWQFPQPPVSLSWIEKLSILLRHGII